MPTGWSIAGSSQLPSTQQASSGDVSVDTAPSPVVARRADGGNHPAAPAVPVPVPSGGSETLNPVDEGNEGAASGEDSC